MTTKRIGPNLFSLVLLLALAACGRSEERLNEALSGLGDTIDRGTELLRRATEKMERDSAEFRRNHPDLRYDR